LEAAEAALPLDVEITLGSYFSFDDAVTLGDTSGLEPFFPPRVSFFYSRENDPFVVTLSTVPEPSSVCLVIALAVGGSFFRSGREKGTFYLSPSSRRSIHRSGPKLTPAISAAIR
jgi:hypothetical protein